MPRRRAPKWQDWSVPPTDTNSTGNANHKATRRSEGSRTAESSWPLVLGSQRAGCWLQLAAECRGGSRPDQPPTSPTRTSCTRTTIQHLQGIGIRPAKMQRSLGVHPVLVDTVRVRASLRSVMVLARMTATAMETTTACWEQAISAVSS